MSAKPDDFSQLPATAPSSMSVVASDTALPCTDRADETSNMRSRVRTRSVDDADDADYAVVTKKPRGRRPKPAATVFTVSKPKIKKNNTKSKTAKCNEETATNDCLDDNATQTKRNCPTQSPTTTCPVDFSRLGEMVSQCVAATLVPVQQELQQLREIVTKLSAQVSEFSAANKISSECRQCHDDLTQQGSYIQKSQMNYAAAVVTMADASQHLLPTAGSGEGFRRSGQQPSSQHEATQEAVTAMYIDQQRKQRRANNIVISGLPTTDNDVMAVTKLLRDEFEWDVADWPGVSVAKCRRLGVQKQNKVQPLLVTLDSREQAAYYIKNARILRSSNSDTIKNSVYINADLTQSEAKAAYELRIQRKRRQQKDQAGRTFYHSHQPAAVATTSQASSSPVNAGYGSVCLQQQQQQHPATSRLVYRLSPAVDAPAEEQPSMPVDQLTSTAPSAAPMSPSHHSGSPVAQPEIQSTAAGQLLSGGRHR